MIQIKYQKISQHIKAIYILIRALPVLSWGLSSSLLGLGLAYNQEYNISWLNYGLIFLLIVIVHGVTSHAFNDREDWLTGTDQLSPGILSGGSGVVSQSLYKLEELSLIGKISILLACTIFIFLIWQIGPVILILLILAFWSALAYSCAPLRLAYHPLTGEWLCAFPAVLGCTAGTFYVFARTINTTVLTAGAIHALLAIGLLMHHHLSDISSDLQASPRKLTTVALVKITHGIEKTPLVELIYFFIAFIAGIAGAQFLNPVFWVTMPMAFGCIGVALMTDPDSIKSITWHEYWLYFLIISDAVIKTSLLFYWR